MTYRAKLAALQQSWADGPLAIHLSGTSEGVLKGWETRRRGGSPEDPHEADRPLAVPGLSSKASAVVQAIRDSGVGSDFVHELYGSDPNDMVASSFDIEGVKDDDFTQVRDHLKRVSQDMLRRQHGDELTVYRGVTGKEGTQPTVSLTLRKNTAEGHADRAARGPSKAWRQHGEPYLGEVKEYRIKTDDVLSYSEAIGRGTFDEQEIIVPRSALPDPIHRLSGTSEGVLKGWETRRAGGGGAKDDAPFTEKTQAAFQEIEDAWAGGVGDFGDPEAAAAIQHHPQYAEYKAGLVDQLTQEYGEQIPVYRAVSPDAYDDMAAGAPVGPIGVTTDPDLAKRWANFAGNRGKTLTIVKSTITPDLAIMRGKSEENEIVVDGDSISFDQWERIGTAEHGKPFIPAEQRLSFARKAFLLYGTTEGILKGWETRRRGGGPVEPETKSRSFERDQGYEWHEQNDRVEWALGLPKEDIAAIDDYAGFGYTSINETLRGTREERKWETQDKKDRIAATTDKINESIRERGYVLKEPIAVNRAAYVPGLSFEELKASEGGVIEEKGFTSTMVGNPGGNRLDSYVSHVKGESIYNRTHGKDVESDEVGTAMRIKIVLPEGTKVALVEPARRIKEEHPVDDKGFVTDWDKVTARKLDTNKDSRREAEVLLGSGAQFRVVSVKQGKDIPASPDGSLRAIPVADVVLEYVGGGSSEDPYK